MPPAPPPHLAVSPWFYAAFLAGVAVMLLLDLGVFNKKAHAPGFKESLGWVTVWSSLAIAFGGLVAVQHGATAALDYYTGWLIEQSLSIDNLFVFVVVFRALKVPSHLQHRVLYWGVLSAVALRAAMIFGGAILVERFAWILYVFGVFLVFTAVRMLVGKGDDPTAEESRVLQWLRGRVRTTGFHGQQFLVREAGRWHATPLLLALVLVEITDVIFAVDSIPAVFAVTTDPFLVFTSNIFAILGLRSLYFVLAGMADRFVYLKPGLGIVLLFVGGKLLLHGVVKVPSWLSLTVIVVVLAGAVLLSLRRPPPARAG
ncbi:MAG: TerC family protein [Planctomycetota bacterium]|jgi:tellurite resistance protein TerC